MRAAEGGDNDLAEQGDPCQQQTSHSLRERERGRETHVGSRSVIETQLAMRVYE